MRKARGDRFGHRRAVEILLRKAAFVVRRIAEDDALVVDLDVGMMVGVFRAGHERADEQHGLGEILQGESRRGLKLLFADEGPGIANLDLAMTDGWTSGTGLGMGLTGAKRLVNEFEIDTKIDGGTRVSIVRWK